MQSTQQPPDATHSATANTASIAANWARLTADITERCIAANRDPESVALLAVSKTRTAEEVRAACKAGARHFGENYLQDALPKLDALSDHRDLVWHFIGAIQSNKTREIGTRFDWVHTLDRAKIARRLNAARPEDRDALNVCIQVNLHDEPQKAGIAPAQLPELLTEISTLERLRLRGLMIIPATEVAPETAFAQLAELFAAARNQLPAPMHANWDTLSMGMSGDYPAAIRCGSTLVRIGTALFGPRPDVVQSQAARQS